MSEDIGAREKLETRTDDQKASYIVFHQTSSLSVNRIMDHAVILHLGWYQKLLSSDSKSDKTLQVSSLATRLKDTHCLVNLATDGATIEDDLSPKVARYIKSHSSGDFQSMTHSTLFVIWMGINDCGQNDEDDLEDIIETLFDCVHKLYVQASARHFLFIDVPPINRSPGGRSQYPVILNERCLKWNEMLAEQVASFASSTPKASAVLFSSHKLLSDILDDPSGHGLVNDEKIYPLGRLEDDSDDHGVGHADGLSDEDHAIWADSLHLTKPVHELIAHYLLVALSQTISSFHSGTGSIHVCTRRSIISCTRSITPKWGIPLLNSWRRQAS